ncbi:MAG: PLP-dependent aminotransferase family protein [Paraburkholderia sp.]|uniref:MocR-like pyridoxine biosynthesis transcription factor PdxR n=1 Tax=Paraburkholderia sp. TaxID=1926495 RepID=UPI003C52B7CB
MLRPSEMGITINRDQKTPPYLQIVHALIEEIRRGRLQPGDALPGSRDLADSLEVNRKTVILAYDELTAQGWLTPERARGTFVSPRLPTAQPAAFAFRPVEAPRVPDEPDFRLPGQKSRVDFLLPEPGKLMFDDGAPDTRLIPVNEMARAYRRSLMLLSRGNQLGYGDPRGTWALRSSISAMLNADRGLNTTAETICLTRGSQMAIFIAARVLTQPGDTAVLESLSYPPAREAFLANGVEVVTAHVDDKGMRLDDLEKICRRKRVRCVYLTPHHQFPTTVLLPPERRLRLLALADQFGFAIIEDDYDHEFHFSHRPMLPLASADQWGKVAYIGSLSKLLTPSLRSGYIAGAKRFVDRVAEEILLIDRQGDPATERAVAEMMEAGEIRRHARKVLRIYDERRLLFADLLKRHFGSAIEFDVPDGGLAFWVRFADTVDVGKLVARAALHGVKLLPGATYSMSGEPTSGLRLGFASLDEHELEEAVTRLAASWKSLND